MKKNNTKNNTKNNKKKKNSKVKKIFKIILLILLIVIIAFAIYFVYNYIRHKTTMGDKDYDPLSATALGIDPEKLKDVGRLNILVLGESDANQGDNSNTPYYLADTIMILSYNPQTQQASILSIPRDTYIGKKDKNTASQNYLASYKINAAYRNRTNIPETLECVNNLTGLELENYLLIDTKAIVEIVDAIGGVWFDVPIDMNYEDLNQDLYIHLNAGEQLIDGAKAEQLLRFRHNQDGTSYPSEYGDNDIGRMRTQREFIQETAKQLLKIENAPKAINLLNIIFNNIKTNLEFDTLKYYIPYAFRFNTANILSDVLPGQPEQCNGIWIFTADKQGTKQLVQDLFTDKIITEDQTNIMQNEITDDTNTVAETTTKSKEKQITIELLNGTKNNEIFTNIKQKLKDEGYVISKSGTTTSTLKTTIVNRTGNSSTTSKKIKDILNAGTITTGSDNAKVDYTIIIGEDYK